ncbi:MAG: hypothetical protein IT482_05780 [Gammaproteobacteria bacterium]|jgi:hypothetical protein|nr:hypothetical protein [Gammaproteobacteria bacterium]
MKSVPKFIAAAVLGLSCSAASAHHSFAMFDLAKDVTVEAVIKEVQFTNPHVWLQILVKDDKGADIEWSIESGAPGMMLRNGWKPSTLKPGDKVTLTMHPLRNGNPGGSLVRVKVPDGRTLGPGAPPPN